MGYGGLCIGMAPPRLHAVAQRYCMYERRRGGPLLMTEVCSIAVLSARDDGDPLPLAPRSCDAGDVNKDLGTGMFNIKLENGVTVMAHLSGKVSGGGAWLEGKAIMKE